MQRPTSAEDIQALCDAGDVAYRAGGLEEALAAYVAALSDDPLSLRALHNASVVARRLGRQSDAIGYKRRLVAAAPGNADYAYDLANLLLENGTYREGWKYFEARTGASRTPARLPDLSIPRWSGESLKGKTIAIWHEQGLGDQIQFARFIPVVRDQARRVILVASLPLVRLLTQLGVEVHPETSVPLVEVDYWDALMSLPGRLGIDVGDIPPTPYLKAPIDALPGAFPPIGVMATGKPNTWNDASRSLDPASAARLNRLGLNLHPEATGAIDMAETAAIIERLELVISVDTSIAHLAGAMGKPCWVLLATAGTDWRWLRDRTDSPWYKGHTVYRQSSPGDWQEVLDRVEAGLAASGFA